jgi:uncharacterized membrane protein YkvA (DUF1232 family)
MKLLPKLKEQALRLKRELHALWLAYADPRTSWPARLLIVCIVAYALSPIDLIPDPIPIIGHIDDLILFPLAIALAIRMIPDSVMVDCRERARDESQRTSSLEMAGSRVCSDCVVINRRLDVAIDPSLSLTLAQPSARTKRFIG